MWQAEEKVGFFSMFDGVGRRVDPAPTGQPSAAATAMRFGDPAELLAGLEAAGFAQVCEGGSKEVVLVCHHGVLARHARGWRLEVPRHGPDATVARSCHRILHNSIHHSSTDASGVVPVGVPVSLCAPRSPATPCRAP